MRVFALLATVVALVHGRPEAGYAYNKPSIPSGSYGVPVGYANGGIGSIVSGGSLIGGGGSGGGASFDGGVGSSGAGIGSSYVSDVSSASFASSSIGSSSAGGGSFGGGSIGIGSFGGGSIGDSSFGGHSFGGGGTLVQKHIYVHVPPPEPEIHQPHRPIHVGQAQKHYKIIFIKAPTAPTPTAPVIPLQPQNEEKTLVYVLVKRPDDQPDIHLPTAAPTQPSKPEVYFIRYKTQKAGIAIDHESSGESIVSANVASSSSSSSSANTLSTSYGPPGHSGPY